MVLHNSYGTVGLVQTVYTLHHVSVAMLVLTLDVVGVGVLDFIRELVLSMALKQLHNIINK